MAVKNRRKYDQRRDAKGIFLPALLFFLLFPYVISNFSGVKKQYLKAEETPGEIWVLQKQFWGEIRVPLEEYLEGMLAATIEAECQMETLKAQAVILRTFCIRNMEKKDGSRIIWDDKLKALYISPQERESLWKGNREENEKKMKQAVRETKGMIAVCKDSIPELPFVRMSNGKTRDITEYTVHTEEFEHMKSVSCPEDGLAEEQVQYMELTINDFMKKIQKIPGQKNVSPDRIVLYRDGTEYVKEVEIGENTIGTEEFRQIFGLVSSCFYLEKINDRIQFKTKGIGHGFGFSQYTADLLAKEGKDYQYLLNYFFQNLTLEKM